MGDGKIGHNLAGSLVDEGHEIVIIDKDPAALEKSESLDVMCIRGNGANISTLIEADAKHCDVVVATTDSDETNMVCCLVAKRLGAKFSIARIRDPEYSDSLYLIKKELLIDMAVNPERTTAQEISRLLRYPFASKVEIFARGRVEMVEFRAQEDDCVVGVPIMQLAQKLPKDFPRVLFCAVEREGEAYIPNGDFVIQPGDHVHVAADILTVMAFFRFMGKTAQRVHEVMIVGGSRIAYYLVKQILSLGMKVSLIEQEEGRARELAEEFPQANIILGDGTDQELLDAEGMQERDAFIALTERDEENLMASIYAQKCGVKKIVLKINRENYIGLVKGMGLDSIVSPKQLTSDTLLRYVRGRSNTKGATVERMYRILGNNIEALEFIAGKNAPYLEVPLKDLRLPKETLLAVIVRDRQVIIPFGNDFVKLGDTVIIITKRNGIKDLAEVLGV